MGRKFDYLIITSLFVIALATVIGCVYIGNQINNVAKCECNQENR